MSVELRLPISRHAVALAMAIDHGRSIEAGIKIVRSVGRELGGRRFVVCCSTILPILTGGSAATSAFRHQAILRLCRNGISACMPPVFQMRSQRTFS